MINKLKFWKKKILNEILKHGIFVDVESAGLNPELNGIVSIGAVTVDGKNEYYGECHLYPWQKAEKAALKINGFSEKEINFTDNHEDKDSAHEAVRLFIEWAKGVLKNTPESKYLGYIIGKNSRWDYEMLRYPWEKTFLKDGPNPQPFPLSHRVIDLTSIAALAYIKAEKAIPAAGITSGDIETFLKMEAESHPHNALNGAKHSRLMLTKLLEKI